ncbi:hypothetical protein V6N13_117475 [Hibiscus sabdariffa]
MTSEKVTLNEPLISVRNIRWVTNSLRRLLLSGLCLPSEFFHSFLYKDKLLHIYRSSKVVLTGKKGAIKLLKRQTLTRYVKNK